MLPALRISEPAARRGRPFWLCQAHRRRWLLRMRRQACALPVRIVKRELLRVFAPAQVRPLRHEVQKARRRCRQRRGARDGKRVGVLLRVSWKGLPGAGVRGYLRGWWLRKFGILPKSAPADKRIFREEKQTRPGARRGLRVVPTRGPLSGRSPLGDTDWSAAPARWSWRGRGRAGRGSPAEARRGGGGRRPSPRRRRPRSRSGRWSRRREEADAAR